MTFQVEPYYLVCSWATLTTITYSPRTFGLHNSARWGIIECMPKHTNQESELRHIITQSEDGHIAADKAIRQALHLGFLTIGSAVSLEGRGPQIAMTSAAIENSKIVLGWRPRVLNERGGTIPVVRASTVINTTIWFAAGGDVNTTHQRNGHTAPALLPEDKAYDLGSYSTRYRGETGQHELGGHRDLIHAVRALEPDQIVGVADLIRNDGTFSNIPDAPGHLVSPKAGGHETLGSILIRGGDVQGLLPEVGPLITGDYEPLPL